MHKKHTRLLRIVEFMVLDAFLIVLTYALAMGLYFLIDIHVPLMDVLMVLPLIIAFKLLSFYLVGVYHIYIDYIGFDDVFRIVLISIITNTVLFFVFLFSAVTFLHPMTLVFIAPFEIALIAGVRSIKKMFRFIEQTFKKTNGGTRVLVIGAGDGGEMVIKDIIRNQYDKTPIAVVDDNDAISGTRLLGVPVVSPIDDVLDFIDYYRVREVIIAIADMELSRLQSLVSTISQKDVKIKRLPLMSEITEGVRPRVMDVKVEDLMNRDEINLDDEGIERFIKEKTVLVTGGGGSIGSELCWQIIKKRPKTLVIFDIYENGAYDIQMKLNRYMALKGLQVDIHVLIGSVYNKRRIHDVFERFKPNLVFHAAAYKHVPLMETSPKEAVRTNVLGTHYTTQAAITHGSEAFILVSSDKAVRPTNVMGATKRYAELIVQSANQAGTTRFSAVRFGNVLDSNGSVIPLFRRQIENGGPVTVTDPNITRYFMTIPEAVGLILQSGAFARGGEIFVLDMGEPIKIQDLAEKMIRLAGYQPSRDIEIEYVGLRPGEKMHEEMLVGADNIRQTRNKKIYVETTATNNDAIDINAMEHAFGDTDEKTLKQMLASSIRSYQANGDAK